MKPWLYTGKVAHQRIGKAANAFTYPALFLCFPLSKTNELSGPLFGLNRFNLFAFFQRDHGDEADALQWIRAVLGANDLSGIADGEVWLHTQPRILGFVFNPVSFWYCEDREGQLRVILCEVNNTFGERHCYLLTAENQGPVANDTIFHCRKVFHVSPFFPVDGEYRFRFQLSPSKRCVTIDYYRHGELVLKTAVSGAAHPLSSPELLKALAKYGWATVMVVLRIHWQALKLWRKGAVFHRKPTPPSLEISS